MALLRGLLWRQACIPLRRRSRLPDLRFLFSVSEVAVQTEVSHGLFQNIFIISSMRIVALDTRGAGLRKKPVSAFCAVQLGLKSCVAFIAQRVCRLRDDSNFAIQRRHMARRAEPGTVGSMHYLRNTLRRVRRMWIVTAGTSNLVKRLIVVRLREILFQC